MSSGRRTTAVVCCMSAEVSTIIEPIRYYRPDRVFLFVSSRDSPTFVAETKLAEKVKADLGDCGLKIISVDTSDFNAVLSEAMDVIKFMKDKYEDVQVFSNISSGTHEFAAAVTMASMFMHTVAFRVDALDYRVSEEDLERMYLEGGLISRVSDPDRLTELDNESPDGELLDFLKVLNELLEDTKYPRTSDIIDGLKELGTWSYDPGRKSNYGRDSLEHKEKVYLKRHYIDPAVERGWIVKPTNRSFALTPMGAAQIDVFVERDECCCDVDYYAESLMCAPVRMSNAAAPKSSILEPDVLFEKRVLDERSYGGYIGAAPPEEEEEDILEYSHGGKRYRLTLSSRDE